ncbi:hypothetical protein [Stenotrophomonas pavanii]|uniref:hypothetical protein n=1 Tax=Stenotrophomonas pavanii TaxID=487698 RepID=UPI0015F4472B|nr:hypothetical protein [Stenotrophomonas pavanii]
MISDAKKLNPNGMGSPKSRDELIALAHEVCAEFEKIHAHMAWILEGCATAKAA